MHDHVSVRTRLLGNSPFRLCAIGLGGLVVLVAVAIVAWDRWSGFPGRRWNVDVDGGAGELLREAVLPLFQESLGSLDGFLEELEFVGLKRDGLLPGTGLSETLFRGRWQRAGVGGWVGGGGGLDGKIYFCSTVEVSLSKLSSIRNASFSWSEKDRAIVLDPIIR